ncbi:hypothetical protein [Runella sp. SP2]|uniref:hypothetical protein n=1 Tax=Runella sp. SP2 TaxID=2268026 RepID=UPI000F07819D|nr:hypothetical protein [Runella sp. SP2]AYQ31760.1 hypothetical protein DTQ70_06005 [Runella sp. SP2]
MVKKTKNTKYISLSMLLVMILYMICVIFKLPEFVMWGVRTGILLVFYKYIIFYFNIKQIDKTGFSIVFFFILWQLINFLRACYYAEGYWMWKNIVNQLFISLFYIIILISVNLKIVRDYLKFYWVFSIPLAILSQLYYQNIQQLNYMPHILLMLCFIFIPKTHKWFLVGLFFLFLSTFEHRNDMGKLIIAFVVGISLIYLHSTVLIRVIKILQFALLLTPIILSITGYIGVFNPFQMDKYIKGDYYFIATKNKVVEKRSFKLDTRTFIYENVLYTLNKNNDFWCGRSPAFGDEGGTFEDNLITGLKGRYGNEVGIMDILLWYGLIGVVLYFLIFIRASYLAIYKSKNRIIKALGLYVSFLWMMSFIWEKPLFETFFMIDLVMLGICLSKQFRYLTDIEMKAWVSSIFVKPINVKKEPYETTLAFKRSIS